ncbi:MAG: carbonic anhydrase [Actinomycetota bacterium]|nr:carbonic anhydrase [Actinomycetota bacterium]MEE2957993.1 carbonic anhydrase [Actinomycetota bacterium]
MDPDPGFQTAGAVPARRLAVVACMDARFDPSRVLGLEVGEAHVVRNAGGIVTDDVVRSLCLSQRLLGTKEVVLLHHTLCGLEGLDEDAFLADVENDAGATPAWTVGSFAEPTGSVRESIRRLRECPFLPHRDRIMGYVYSVETGTLEEVGAGT